LRVTAPGDGRVDPPSLRRARRLRRWRGEPPRGRARFLLRPTGAAARAPTARWRGWPRCPPPASARAARAALAAAPGPPRRRVRHLRARSTRPGRCEATDPVQQRYQRGDHIATDDARINDRIRAREVLLIGAGGEQLGVKPLPEALTIAREEELDLVEVAPNANPPVCRIMNYGRYKYEQE